MATGMLAAAANTALDAMLANYSWVTLHTGDPGAAGTSNPATETTRKQATWAASSGGASSNTGALTWTNISGSQQATFFSVRTASSAGSVGFTGTMTGNAYTAGDTLTIAISGVAVSYTLAS